MKVELLNYTPLHIASHAIRKCWDSGEKSDTYESVTCNTCEYTHDEYYDHLNGCDKCASSFEESENWYRYTTVCGLNDSALIERVGNKFKHASTLEHLVYSLDISGVSRALLQELARHRHQNLSVESTRYTMSKKLKFESNFLQE